MKLDAKSRLLDRDVVVIDLRLPDRVTVRLPEGRSLEDVTSEGGTIKATEDADVSSAETQYTRPACRA